MSMPTIFVSHGSPTLILENAPARAFLASLGGQLPRPTAIVAVSAHWGTDLPAVSVARRPATIHDFYGFPEELFAVEYPARGDPALAGEITELVKPTWVGQDRDSWGIDHGAWSVLVHAFPSADIPVVQLSANALKPFDYHLELGAKLAPLREQGVLVLASGNIVHNLGRMDWAQPDTGYPWVRSFDDSAREVMTADPAGVPELQAHQYFSAAVPTPDHFIPLLYLAGLAASDGNATEVLVDGYAMGSLSMTAYTLGCERIVYDGVGGAPVLPKIPPDESNI